MGVASCPLRRVSHLKLMPAHHANAYILCTHLVVHPWWPKTPSPRPSLSTHELGAKTHHIARAAACRTHIRDTPARAAFASKEGTILRPVERLVVRPVTGLAPVRTSSCRLVHSSRMCKASARRSMSMRS